MVFGYLQIQKSELLVREYETYKAVYCGLCKQMGREYSFLSRFALSYDCTFYAMLIMSLKRSCSGFDNGRCRFNPLKKCQFAHVNDDAYSKSAALTVILAYYKLKDDISDSGFFKRIGARLLLPFFSHWRKKAAKRFAYLDEAAAQMMASQLALEGKDNPCLDETAHPTATMLAAVLRHEGEDEATRRVLSELGYQLGRWIYFMDAADDLEKDIKRGSFNPFKNLQTDDLQGYQTQLMNHSLARAYDAYNLLNITDFKGMMDNMLLYGFPARQNAVVHHTSEEESNDKSI